MNVSKFKKLMNGFVIAIEEDKRFWCVWLFYFCEQFCRFANEGAKISMSSPTS